MTQSFGLTITLACSGLDTPTLLMHTAFIVDMILGIVEYTQDGGMAFTVPTGAPR